MAEKVFVTPSRSLLPYLVVLFLILGGGLVYQALTLQTTVATAVPSAAPTLVAATVSSPAPVAAPPTADAPALAAKDATGAALVAQPVSTNLDTETNQITQSLNAVGASDFTDTTLSDQQLGL